MKNLTHLLPLFEEQLHCTLQAIYSSHGETTFICDKENLKPLLTALKNHPATDFNQLIDICGVDYLYYGRGEWETFAATEQGFSRGVELQPAVNLATPARFGVVYHLLSTTLNHRIRVKTFLEADALWVNSVCDLWQAANWFEREAYDLYGILFSEHPDLRRILTDYGFIGYPFRKDFPLSGTVEMRYDATLKKVIYEPVTVEPRITVPKVIREDNRYLDKEHPHD